MLPRLVEISAATIRDANGEMACSGMSQVLNVPFTRLEYEHRGHGLTDLRGLYAGPTPERAVPLSWSAA